MLTELLLHTIVDIIVIDAYINRIVINAQIYNANTYSSLTRTDSSGFNNACYNAKFWLIIHPSILHTLYAIMQ